MQKGKKGSRVRHATKTEWGVGQLLEDANSQSFHVFFEGAGEKFLTATAADKLIWVNGAEAQSALLDNLYLQPKANPAPCAPSPKPRRGCWKFIRAAFMVKR